MKREGIVVNEVGFRRRTVRLLMAVGGFLILVVQGLSASPVKDIPATSSSEVLDATDVAVIHAAVPAALGYWFDGRATTAPAAVVVMVECGADGKKDHGFWSVAPIRERESTAPLMCSLIARNALAFTLAEPVSSGTVTIAGERQVHELKKAGKLESRFGAKRAYFQAWLPGYNRSRTEAVVYVWAYEGGDDAYSIDGAGHLYFLRREGTSWTVVRKQEVWIT